VAELRRRFLEYMVDDFYTGGAVGVLFVLLTALIRFADSSGLEGPDSASNARAEFERGVVVLRELSGILGLFREPPAAPCGGNDQLVAGLVELLIELRNEARKAKNYAQSDQIRKRLGELGVTLEDRKGGTDWRIG
jgi:cysteinyl-tRNA synthetase